MTSGGARVRSGSFPDPNALRRERSNDAGYRHLASEPRLGDPPAWPLSRQTAREATMWAEEWRRPQSVIWLERGQEREVALYVRALGTAEQPKAGPTARRLVLTFMDDLGITQGGLARNRWVIDVEPTGPTRVAPTGTASAKRRLELLRD